MKSAFKRNIFKPICSSRDFRSAGISKKGKAGFSFIELLMGFTVMGIIFASSFALLGQGFAIIETARDDTRASQILQSEMEALRTKSWVDIEALPDKESFIPGAQFVASYAQKYKCERIIQDRKSEQKEIILKVSWRDHKGMTHSRRYITYFTKGGLNDYYTRSF